MAIGLNALHASISRNLSQCMKHSFNISNIYKPGWRFISSIALNPEFLDDSYTSKVKDLKTQDLESVPSRLKEKENGDWRHLTLSEKQALYRLSFSHPFCSEVEESTDAWKFILAGSFSVMGIMTLAMYAYKSNLEASNAIDPLMDSPISLKKNKDQF